MNHQAPEKRNRIHLEVNRSLTAGESEAAVSGSWPGSKIKAGTLQITAEENFAHLFLKFFEDFLKTVADGSAKESEQMQLGGPSNESSSPRGRFQQLCGPRPWSTSVVHVRGPWISSL